MLFSEFFRVVGRRPFEGLVAGLGLLLLGGGPAAGQVPGAAWSLATTGSLLQASGSSYVRATATDASGNVFVTGNFVGSVAFGNTLLTSAGNHDLFVAKYVPSTGTWAWAQSGGGTGSDYGYGLAVSGNNVYLTGSFNNSTTNTLNVLFGGTGPTTGTTVVRGASALTTPEMLVAKYVDQGSSATLSWVQVAGGSGYDQGTAIAVSGSSVYVTGSLTNNTANVTQVVFGGTAATVGTVPQYGASPVSSPDVLLAKYTDNGATATFNWCQVAGGTRTDAGYGVAVSGPSVYLTGTLFNNTANANGVLFGGTGLVAGTVPQHGASLTASPDLLVAKYTDNGATATFGWSQVGGGTRDDDGAAIGVSGTSVYVAGSIYNTTTNASGVVFGGSGAAAGTAPQYGTGPSSSYADIVLAKYTDNGPTGSLGWTQVAGSNDDDHGTGLAVSGSAVYLVGYCTQTHPTVPTVTLGGSGTTPGTVLPANTTNGGATDLLVAKYLDNGAAATVAWALAGGGGNFDACGSVALAGTSLFVGGGVGPSPYYSFGAVPTPLLNDNGDGRAIVAQLSDAGAAGTWEALASVFGGGTSITRATATDASGNVLVAGTFTGQVVFGSTVLSSVGKSDFFVAKYVPATNTWAWAQRGGGTDDDYAYGVAASGGSVYVTGSIYSNQANDNAVTFSGAGPAGRNAPQPGTSPWASHDLFVVKYADQGTSAPVGWLQVAGGYGPDGGRGIAASSQGVYVTGTISNNATNDSHVLFGRTGTVAGTQLQYGTSYMPTGELVLAKYLDQGSSATVAWTQVAGGDDEDTGYGVAVQGASIYVTGLLTNDRTDWNHVRFGGSANILGTQLQYGATTVSRADMVLAKYVDQGTAATVAWTQVGGGQSIDYGSGVAVSGSSVYVAGTLTNNRANVQAAVFGGAGTVAGTAPQYGASPTDSYDQFVAKYTDNGPTATFGWSQVGGGTRDDYANGIVAAGTGVFVVGSTLNTRGNGATVLFGGAGTALGTTTLAGLGANFSNDLVVAGYTDNGPTATLAWTRIGGGSDPDYGYAAALSGTTLYAVGSITPLGTFGNLTVSRPAGSVINVLGALSITAMLPTVAAQLPAGRLALFPNPAPGVATLSGATAGASVGIFDALGRRVATATADAQGTAALPGGLAPGLYLVRAGAATVRWVVE